MEQQRLLLVALVINDNVNKDIILHRRWQIIFKQRMRRMRQVKIVVNFQALLIRRRAIRQRASDYRIILIYQVTVMLHKIVGLM